MPHIIYQTEGIILSKGNFGEAESVFSVFTEDFGKIRAAAQGVRHIKSKLRYNLDLFSYRRFSVIAGRHGSGGFWKIVDAEEISPGRNIFSDTAKTAVFSRVASLLDRMVQGEERNPLLWSEIKNIFHFLRKESVKKEELRDFEISAVFNILKNLGYIGGVSPNVESENRAFVSAEDRQTAVSAINRAIKESML